MIFPIPPRPKWSAEETALAAKHSALIDYAVKSNQSRLALQRGDGTWFNVVVEGRRLFESTEFNPKETAWAEVERVDALGIRSAWRDDEPWFGDCTSESA